MYLKCKHSKNVRLLRNLVAEQQLENVDIFRVDWLEYHSNLNPIEQATLENTQQLKGFSLKNGHTYLKNC